MQLNEILKQIPDYKEFMTVNELDKSSQHLADEYESVEFTKIGESTEGRPISYLKIGEGSKNTLLFAFPHPNEPIGSLTIEFLSRYLAENPEVTSDLGYTWYLIKAIDPDGAALNEGWFKGKFSPIKYAKNFYRPAPHEQIEWTFPIKYKNSEFLNPTPETKTLMRLMEGKKPSFMYSLHNAGFCGVYWYITHAVEAMYSDFISLANQVNLPVHKGESEAPFIKKLHPAIFEMMGLQELYDFYENNGVENPEELIKAGTSSADYLKRLTNGQGFTLVCEMPYFYDRILDDDSLSEFDRREKVLESLEYFREANEFLKPRFETIKKHCDQNSRLFTSVADGVENFEKRIAPQFHHAQTSPMYEGKATNAQAFDSIVSERFYGTLRTAMAARLCNEKNELQAIQSELDLWVEQTIQNLLKKSEFEVVPIQKLVQVQVGSAFITMQHLN
ncbi:MAG: M14 family zinc carboxypeptidase [Candidatus Kariarchaeaceae archaeon]|jgi:hypothetical protein